MECGLVLQKNKADLLSWDGALPWEAPAAMVLAKLEVETEHLSGFLCYGMSVGNISSHWIQGVPSGVWSPSLSALPSSHF